MPIFIAISSIFLLAVLTWLVNRVLSFRICPICAGVSGTWLWMFVGMFLEILPVASYQLPVAILIGGSVVGIAYRAEKKLLARRPVRQSFNDGGSFSGGGSRGKSSLLWKPLFIPAGFAAAYGLVLFQWAIFFAGLAASLFLAILFFAIAGLTRRSGAGNIKEIEKQLEECC